MKAIIILILISMVVAVSAGCANVLSDKVSTEVEIKFPAMRMYSLNIDGPWQVEPISFYYDGDPGNSCKPKEIVVYIRMENHVDTHFDMNIYHNFSCDTTPYSPILGNHLTYGILKDNGKWESKCMQSHIVWPRVEHTDEYTVIRYYKQTYVNDIEPKEVRIERVVYKFKWFYDQPGTYTYDSHIELVGSKFK